MVNTPNPTSSNQANGDQQSMQKLKQGAGYIVSAIVIALVGYFGWEYMQNSGASIDTAAADKYALLEQTQSSLMLGQDPTEPLSAEATKELNTKIDTLVAEHGSTIYAWQALMLKAKNAADVDNFDVAVEALEKALDIELNDPGLHTITQLRYATALLGRGDIEKAKAAATTDVPLSFESTQQELLGDIYLAQGDKEKAERAYENAWSLLSKRQEERASLRLKLESLGVTPEPIQQPEQIVNQAALSEAAITADIENITTEESATSETDAVIEVGEALENSDVVEEKVPSEDNLSKGSTPKDSAAVEKADSAAES